MRRLRPWLGTFVEVGARGEFAGDAVDAAFAEVADAHRRWSFHEACSELSRLNAQPGIRTLLSRRTTRLLRAARTLMQLSDGAFDCTVGNALVDMGALPRHHAGPALPRHRAGPALLRGCAGDIELGLDWARLRRPIRLTLDGIAKGWAVDLAIAAMQHRGCRAGWVNAGGDLRVFGDLVLPVHRRLDDGELQALGGLRDGAVATSVVAAAPAADAGRWPGRVVGRPGHAAAAGTWTVLSATAWRADALTKVAANTPAGGREALVGRLGGRLLPETSR